MGPIYSVADFLDMLRRRAGLITLVFLVGCVVSLFYASAQQHVYRSSEVIQIEQPKIKNELAPSSVDSSAARRLQLIEQQVMARDSLLEIIDKFGLYADMPGLLQTEKVHRLRMSVSITGVAAVREGFADDGAIAVLTITADMDSPERARAVAHEIADRTRALAAAQRAETSRETLAFFQQQEDQLIAQIAALEEEITAFNMENDLAIEGNIELRRDEIASLNDALLELDREIIATQLARSRIDRNARDATVEKQEAEIDAELNSLTTQRRLLEQRRATLSKSLEVTPEVERAQARFERRMNNLQGQLNVIAQRRSEAEVGFSLEEGAQSERMITLEEAQAPEAAITRGRKITAMMGAAAALIAGIALAFVLDFLNPVVRSAKQMERETGLRPVVSIPVINNPRKRSLRQIWQDRRAAGRRGRAARLARKNRDLPLS